MSRCPLVHLNKTYLTQTFFSFFFLFTLSFLRNSRFTTKIEREVWRVPICPLPQDMYSIPHEHPPPEGDLCYNWWTCVDSSWCPGCGWHCSSLLVCSFHRTGQSCIGVDSLLQHQPEHFLCSKDPLCCTHSHPSPPTQTPVAFSRVSCS